MPSAAGVRLLRPGHANCRPRARTAAEVRAHALVDSQIGVPKECRGRAATRQLEWLAHGQHAQRESAPEFGHMQARVS